MDTTILGIDFTSAPCAAKPITCAHGGLSAGQLLVKAIETIRDHAGFEKLLGRAGPWIAGFDFPFSQPRVLIETTAWPNDWASYVSLVHTRGREYFASVLQAYRDTHLKGQKQPGRAVDRLARSCSPMMMYGTPVAKMFFEGAPRLAVAGVSVVPCRPCSDDRIAVEAYPKLVAKKWIGKAGYKSDARSKQTPARRAARERIVNGLVLDAAQFYGISVEAPMEIWCRCVDDRER